MARTDDFPYCSRRCGGFEISVADCTGHAFSKHAHDEFVVSANISGWERIWLDGRNYEAGPRDLTVYNPGQVQAGHARGTIWRIASIYIDSRWLTSATGTAGDPHFDRPLLGNGAADALREIVARALWAGEPQETIEQSILSLVCAFPWGGKHAERPRTIAARDLARRVAARLREEIAAPSSLAELARSEGLSRVALLRAFSAAFGMPPFAWLGNERLKEARRRLSKGDGPADIAADLGFADQSHLTRAFKAAYGVTPARYAGG